MSKLNEEIRAAINRCCAENGSDTPDFILAEYLTNCLNAYNKAVKLRDSWYRRDPLHTTLPEINTICQYP